MLSTTVFHEDVYYAYFQPFRQPSTSFNIWGGHGLETFGADLQIVNHFDQNFVWTVVDSSDGPDQWITPGRQYVNRLCYLLTTVPHNFALIEFRAEGKPRSITSSGLVRRMTVLRKIMRANESAVLSSL